MANERNNQGSSENSRSCTMSSSVAYPLGGVVFSKIRCYLKPEYINTRKFFGKTKVQLVFSYNKKQKNTTKSELTMNNDKSKKRASWSEQIYYELLSNASTEFLVSVYNTSISGPDGRLGEATQDLTDTTKFKFEENRITLPLLKQGEEEIGEVSFHVHLLSNEPPKYMMERVSDPSNRAKKIGVLLINNVKFKNLAGRRGTLEVKLRDESHSTEGYWNTTTKDWKYPIALNIIANATLDLVIQCRYTEHERASTRICLGPDGGHEHIWKSLMNGPFKVGELSLQDQEFDSARIEFTLSCHKIVSAKTLFNLIDEEEEESTILDVKNEEEQTKPMSAVVRTITMNNNTIARTGTKDTVVRTSTMSSKASEPNGYIQQQRIKVYPNQRDNSEEENYYREFQKFDSSIPKLQQHQLPPVPTKKKFASQQPPVSNVIGDHSTNAKPLRNISVRSQSKAADSSQIYPQPDIKATPPIPLPPKHPQRYPQHTIIEEEPEPIHVPVHSSPPSSDPIIGNDHYENVVNSRDKFRQDSYNSTGSSPPAMTSHSFPQSIPPQYKSPMGPDVKRQFAMSPPPPPYPKQTNNNATAPLRIICQRYVIVNPLRLGNSRGRREEASLYPQNKLYKGHHILSGLNVVIKEFSSQVSWEYETTYLKELKSRHIIKWVDMESDQTTGEYYSITEHYGRALQLEACKFNMGKRRQVFENICAAVSWIHSKDVVHLDLNPSNIICKEGKENHKIRICDFETSRQFGDVIQLQPTPSDVQSIQSFDTRSQYSNSPYQVQQYSQYTQFTMGYTCPELMLVYDDGPNEVYTHLNQDIFSVGCILYFLYTCRVLYSSLEEIEENNVALEGRVRKDIEDDVVVDLILRCISRNPTGRPTIDDIMEDIYFDENEIVHEKIRSRSSRGSGKSECIEEGSDDEEDGLR